LVPIPKRSTSPRGDIDTVAMDGLKALDLERPIREADIERLRFGASQPDAGTPFR
jgi:hypothetical protein